MGPVKEVVLFHLKEGVSEADFLRESAIVQEWIEQQEGFVERELLKAGGDQWLDTVRWNDLENAEKAAAKIMNTAHCQPFMTMIDETSIQMWHFEPQAIPVK